MALSDRDSTLYPYITSDGPDVDWKVLARGIGNELPGERNKKVEAIRAFRENARFWHKPGLYEVKCLVEEYARRLKAGELTEEGVSVQRVVLDDKTSLTLTKANGFTTITYTRVEAEQLYDNEVAQAIANAVLAYANR